MKAIVPWQMKLVSKIVLSRINISYSWWSRFNLFKHGFMEKPEYAFSVFHEHIADFKQSIEGITIMELGPGDTLYTAMLSNSYNVECCYLVDVGDFASKNLSDYARMEWYLKNNSCFDISTSDLKNRKELLDLCHAQYLTKGLESLRTIESSSVDFVFSHAVLEHVGKGEFEEVQKELFRVLKVGGICSHRIDLKDHLNGRLNNLRFSSKLWESKLFKSSGFYTNRIRYDQMIKMFRAVGFLVQVKNIDRWEKVPIELSKIHKDCEFTSDDIDVCGFDVVLKKV